MEEFQEHSRISSEQKKKYLKSAEKSCQGSWCQSQSLETVRKQFNNLEENEVLIIKTNVASPNEISYNIKLIKDKP